MTTQHQVVTVVLYATCVPALPKVRTDIATIKRILDAKKVQYEEVDLTTYSERREEMQAASGISILPQLHVNGKFVGLAHDIQELEDYGELDAHLQGKTPDTTA